ncbi:hypothetical protein DFAR_3460002 [Desulfarculales bacterium]
MRQALLKQGLPRKLYLESFGSDLAPKPNASNTLSVSAHWPWSPEMFGQREIRRLALGHQQAAPIRVSNNMGHRLTGLHPGTL